MNNVKKDFRNRFNELLERKIYNGNRLTQEKLAERLYVTRQAVSQWSKGNTTPSIDILAEIANVYGVSTDYLLGVSDCESVKIDIKQASETVGLSSDRIIYLQRYAKRRRWQLDLLLSHSCLGYLLDDITIYTSCIYLSMQCDWMVFNRICEREGIEVTETLKDVFFDSEAISFNSNAEGAFLQLDNVADENDIPNDYYNQLIQTFERERNLEYAKLSKEKKLPPFLDDGYNKYQATKTIDRFFNSVRTTTINQLEEDINAGIERTHLSDIPVYGDNEVSVMEQRGYDFAQWLSANDIECVSIDGFDDYMASKKEE